MTNSLRMSKSPVPLLFVLCIPAIAAVVIGSSTIGLGVDYTFLVIGLVICFVDELGHKLMGLVAV